MVDLNAKSAKLISVTTAKEIAQHCLLLELKLSMCQVSPPHHLPYPPASVLNAC
jgi:hypothetical protein